MNAYPIDNLWRKGHYMQRLEVNGRDFVRGKPVKSRGTIEVKPKDIGQLPAWILRTSAPHSCGECGRPKPVTQLIAAYPSGWRLVGEYDRDELQAIIDFGPPESGTDPNRQVEASLAAAMASRQPVYVGTGDVEPF